MIKRLAAKRAIEEGTTAEGLKQVADPLSRAQCVTLSALEGRDGL